MLKLYYSRLLSYIELAYSIINKIKINGDESFTIEIKKKV